MKFGDFTGLAQNYSKYRPGYASHILSLLQGYIGDSFENMPVADVGAGTGIFSRMLAGWGADVVSVEPNQDMREAGVEDCKGHRIQFKAGSAEKTSLATSSVHFLSMASSFHWADFDKATAEFQRVLKPGGVFAALWNPRRIERNPLLLEIEQKISELCPELKRVSSGNSEFTKSLFDRLQDCGKFSDVVYLEAEHVMEQTKAHYLGVWNSVNDIRVQLGEARWEQFIDYLEKRIDESQVIHTSYKTRLWLARSNKQ